MKQEFGGGETADGRTAGDGSAVGHIRSFYAETAKQIDFYPPLQQDRKCDVCVVGGGLAGLTAARELARNGKDVVLIEARRLAWAASGRNGGFVSPGFAESILAIEKRLGLDHARRLYRLSAEGAGYVRATIREEDAEHIIGGHGRLRLIRHRDVNWLERYCERLARDYSISQTFVPGEGLSAYLNSDTYTAGLTEMSCFHIQPLEYANLLGRLAARHGASVNENTKARSVKPQDGKWIIATEGGSRITSAAVVLATSVYGGPAARVNAAMVPVATYVMAARSPSRAIAQAIRFRGCISDMRRSNDYYRLIGSGDDPTLIWGGRMTTQRSEPARLAEKLKHDIRKVYPQLDDLVVTHAWSGLMGYPVHKMPILVQPERGLWIATGFGGHGLNTTAMAGSLVASAIVAGDDRYRLFEPFGLRWAGGVAGRIAAQSEYWRLRTLDWLAEHQWFGR